MQGGLTKFRILFHCLLDGGQFTVSRSSAWIEKRPHSARLHGRTGATGYYIFRSCGQGFPLEGEGFFDSKL